MALPKNVLFLPLSEGINQKSDPFQAPEGSLEKAQNFRFLKKGRIDAIRGFGKYINKQQRNLNQTISTLDSLLGIDNEAFYRVDGEDFVKLSDVSFASSSSAFLYRAESNITSAALAVHNENAYSVYFVEGEQSYRFKITRVADNRVLRQGNITSLTSASKRVKVFVYNNEVFVSYLVSGVLNVYNIDLNINTRVGTGISDYDLDIKTNSLDFIGITATKLKSFSYSLSLTENPISIEIQLPADVHMARSVHYHSDSSYSVVYNPSDNNRSFKVAYGGVYNSTSQQITAPTSVLKYPTAEDNSSSFKVEKIGSKYYVFLNDRDFEAQTFDSSSPNPAFSFFLADFKLVGAVNIDNRNLLFVNHLEGCFLIDGEKNVYCEINANNNYELSAYEIGSFGISDNKLYMPFIAVTSTEGAGVEGGSFRSGTAVSYATVEFSDSAQVSFDEAKDTAFISGSPNLYYDGTSVTEYNFNHKPKIVGLDDVDASSLNIYGYAVIYKWIDGRGLEHRSFVTTKNIRKEDPISPSSSVIFNISNLYLTGKEEVRIEIYRTVQNGGSTYRKIASLPSQKNLKLTQFTDTNTDTEIGSFELLYTSVTGGVSNIQPDACRGVEAWRDRIYLYGIEKTPNRIAISQPFDSFNNRSIEFTGLSNINLPDPVISVKGLDDFLIIFTTKKIYRWNDSLNFPLEIQTSKDLTASRDGAVFKFSEGIVFQAFKGIYVLTRGLSLQYIGAYVEDFNHQQVIDVNESRTSQEIYFLLEDRSILVFNYFFMQWTTYFDKAIINMTVNDNKVLFLTQDGFILDKDKEDSSNEETKHSFETQWINFGKIQGFSRFNSVTILGNMNDVSDMTMSVAYNGKEGFYDIIPAIPSGTDTIQDVIRSQRSVYGERGDKQLTIDPSIQKCFSFKLKFDIKTKGKLDLSNIGIKYQYNEEAGISKVDHQLQYGAGG